MTRTGFDPKVSTIRPEDRADTAPAGSEAGPLGIGERGDAYSDSEPDVYKAIVTGQTQPKASAIAEAYIAEMMGSMEEGGTPARQDPIQDLLGELAIGGARERRPSDEGFEIPNVPDLYKDLYDKIPGAFTDNLPIVERYAALEKYAMSLAYQANRMLNPANMHKFSVGELRRLRAYREKLDKILFKCRQQLAEARLNLNWEVQNRKASAEIARERRERGEGS